MAGNMRWYREEADKAGILGTRPWCTAYPMRKHFGFILHVLEL